MALKISDRITEPDAVIVTNDHAQSITLFPDDQRQLLDELARNFGMVLVSQEEVVARANRPKPVGQAIRVARYLQGRLEMPGLDSQEIHGVAIHQEDEPRTLLASDLRALLDYIREA